MARYIYDKTNHVEIPITGDPDPTNFVGTLAQWEGLTQAEKNLYDSVDLTDDYYDVEEELQSMADNLYAKQDKTDNDLETTSKTVVGAINEVKGSVTTVGNQLKVGSDTFYFDSHDGKFGYNTSANRGADTFHPFSDALKAVWNYEFDTSPTIPTTISTTAFVGRTYELDAIVPVKTSAAKCLFSFGGSNSGGGVITLSTGNFGLYANGHIVNDSSVVIDQNRHHFGIVLGSGFVRLYVDKVLYKSYSANGTSAMKTSTSFRFGNNESSASENWSGGTLYKLAITNRSDGVFIL